MTHFTEQWAGVCLDGEYTLERYLDAAGDGAAWFEAARGPEKILLKVAPAQGGEQRLEMWRRTAHLQHPSLLCLLGCGRGDASDGEPCVYAAFEWPDESLASAPVPLTQEDATELLTAALDALRYLHAQGLVHGSIKPANVLAAGTTIKLSTDDLHEPDSGRFTYAEDIGAVGALLYWVITGREYEGTILEIPEPFASIVRNTAGSNPADRWRIPEIVAALPPALPPPVEEPPAEEPPRAEPPEPVPAPVPESTRVLPSPRPAPPRIPVWAWPLSIAAIAACFAWVFHTPGPKKTQPIPAQPAPISAPQPAVPPPATAPDPVPPVEAAAPQSGSAERTVWRVVAYTYNALRDAKRKALAINKKWPGLNAEVFAPKGVDHPPYLVALGGRMNRIEAVRVLQKARSRGLPRDTFMLNFSD